MADTNIVAPQNVSDNGAVNLIIATKTFAVTNSSGKNVDDLLSDLQTEVDGKALKSHTHTKSQITDFPTTLKNPTAITVKLNGGTTEGTNLFTYDGSAAKSLDITPAAIGAAAASHGTHVTYGTTTTALTFGGTGTVGTDTKLARADHTHTLPALPTSLKNPNALTISLNGTSQGAYDGSATKTIDITPASIGAAAASHTHGNADITGLDASKLTGTIDIARLPAGALERCLVVADDAARFALTAADVQLGDTVKVTSTGKMYFVTDAANLSTEDGYEVYTAGTATSVPWSGITGKPATYAPSAHTHTKSQITDFPASLKNPTVLTVQFNGTTNSTYDGSTATTVNITPAGIGAAPTSHNHTMAQITDLPESFANPYDIVIKLNGGTTEGTNMFTYNGDAAKTVDITPAGIGAAAASHGTHVTYATAVPLANGTAAVGTSAKVAREDHVHPLQTSVSGNAGSATKFATARNITIGNQTKAFDGTANIAFDLATIGAAATSHTHSAANITSGVLDIARIPAAALTRITTVADTTALYQLTTAEVQLGDLVKCTGNGTTYVVKDEANLNSADGYEAITAGSAASVAWNNVSGKPSTFTPATHTHTKSQITDFPASLKNPNAITISLNGTSQGAYDGSAAKSINITAASVGAATSTHNHTASAVTDLSATVVNLVYPVGRIYYTESSTENPNTLYSGTTWVSLGAVSAYTVDDSGTTTVTMYVWKRTA